MSDAHEQTTATEVDEFDAVVVGAGFAGIYALHRLRDTLGLSVRVYDIADDVGGTWYWNRYPGARCDIESYHYSYSFSEQLQQEWTWSEHFASQPEILQYLDYVADKFDLRRDMQFNTRVTSAAYDDTTSRWEIRTSAGAVARAQFLVCGVGNLSVAKDPDFPGLDTFGGEVYSTGAWPHDGVDFTGRRVGVVGTGASGIQVIPKIAADAECLTVFQRTPNYATPIGNAPLRPEEDRSLKAHYGEIRRRSRNHFLGVPYDKVQPSALAASRQKRRSTYEQRWQEGGFRLFIDSFQDILFDHEANETAAEFIRDKIRQRVDDPETAETLAPKDHPYATKRPPLETDYYETFNRDNVTLVDVKESPIEEVTPAGIRTSSEAYEFDTLVLATGFDAMTGPLLRMGVTGRDGIPLEQRWSEGPRTYLGLAVHGFPNMFIVTGPQSPSVLYNMPLAIEDHVDMVADCIEYMRARGVEAIEPTAEAEENWVHHTRELADATLVPSANSWYMGANIPGKPRICMVYLGGAPAYREECDEAVEAGYKGFSLSPAPPP